MYDNWQVVYSDQAELDLRSIYEYLAFSLLAPFIRKLTFEEDVDTIRLKLKEYFAECGIKFAIVKHFIGAPVQGVIKTNIDGTLNLIMTVRNKFADVFWFTLFHEIGHIVNGDIKDRLIDYEFTKNEIEDRANQFAANKLIDASQYRLLVEAGDFSLLRIRQFCSKQNIPTYILIGRLQRDGYLKYHQYSDEKIRYELDRICYQGTKRRCRYVSHF